LKVVQNILSYTSEKPTVLTIGTFDGVHLGHQKIIERLTKTSESDGLESVILTFFPHPRMVLQQNSDIKLLNTMVSKLNKSQRKKLTKFRLVLPKSAKH
jgi:riboflavin kinase/FMN adenylyltransferase